MASNEYIIRILYDTPDGSSVGMAPVESSAAGAGGAAPAKPSPAISAGSVASSLASAGINTAITMKTQQVNTVTGSGQLARKQSMNNAIAKGASDAIMSGLGGASVAASLGSALGIGTGVGAVIGVAMTAVNKVLDIATSMADLQNKATVEKASISATMARGTISWDRSRGR